MNKYFKAPFWTSLARSSTAPLSSSLKKFGRASLPACFGLLVMMHADAAEFPVKPITLIVPYSVGGGVDAMARTIAKGLSQSLKMPVMVENVPGADSLIGTQRVLKAAPDGYTLLLAIPGLLMIKHLHKNLPVDPVSNLRAISMIAQAPGAVVVPGRSSITTVAELANHCKNEGTGCSWGSGEQFSALVGKAIVSRLEIRNLTNVIYKGGAPMLNDLMGGHVDFGMSSVSASAAHHKSGIVRILAVGSDKRFAKLPGVPTFAEAGLANIPFAQFWYGLFAPKGIPENVAKAINEAMSSVAKDESALRIIDNLGATPAFSGSNDFAMRIKEDDVALAELVRRFPLDSVK